MSIIAVAVDFQERYANARESGRVFLMLCAVFGLACLAVWLSRLSKNLK